ncbi:MAG: DNA topoisomerase IB [Pseudomonadota bacterium]
MAEAYDIAQAAAEIGLDIVESDALAWTREAETAEDGTVTFRYRNARGREITNPNAIARLNALAIPPAYRDVRVSPNPNGHLQAVGTDEAGRVQYRYWDQVREREKARRLSRLIRVLPRVRRRVAADLKARGAPRERAIAAAVRLIDSAHVRVGNDGYLKANKTRGATTLLKRQIKAKGRALALRFKGKSGRTIAKRVESSSLVRALKSLSKLPGRRAFQYRDDKGAVRAVTAQDVNAYLAEVSGAPVTAKDFRTLAASAKAAERLAEIAPADADRARAGQVNRVIETVAEDLQNTPAVARKSYVHDRIVEGFETGDLAEAYAASRGGHGVSRAERTVAKLVDETAASPA